MPNEDITEMNPDSPSMAASVKSQAPVANSCSLVIFGANGDLTKRLLTPALYNLASGGLLPDDFKVFGVDRGQHTEDAWKDTLAETMRSFTKDRRRNFTRRISAKPHGRGLRTGYIMCKATSPRAKPSAQSGKP